MPPGSLDRERSRRGERKRAGFKILAFFIFFLFGFLGAGCNALTIDEIAQTSIARTKTARPRTITPSPTMEAVTPTASITHTPTPSRTPPPATATSSPSPTPDLRVIDLDPGMYLLDESDLPGEPDYYLPSSNWISPHRNFEVIYEYGQEEGEMYIEKTGRLDGWWVNYRKGSTAVQAPQEIYHNIVKYKTVNGARLTIEKYNLAERDDQYQILNEGSGLGEASVVMIREEVLQGGVRQVTYRIETAYRNFVSVIMATGPQGDMDYEFIEDVARIVINKLSAAPLSESPAGDS